MNKNLVFLDVETTGIDADAYEIIELGAVVVRQTNDGGTISYEVISELDLKIKPEHIETADPVALRVNGYDPANWVFAYSLKEAMTALAEKAKDGIMVAHNVTFDAAFIEKAWKLSGVKNTMHYHKLDTISIAFTKFHGKGEVDKFSLHYLCEHFHVENKNAHTALSDARATFELYKKLMNMA